MFRSKNFSKRSRLFNTRSQVATTAIAILLALLAAGAIIGVSPTGIGQTVTVTPGSDTKIVNTITVADGMLINITNSTCIITDPAYATTVISPMTAEGSDVDSPYISCISLNPNYGYIGQTTTNLTIFDPDLNGFNQSIFILENEFIRLEFSASNSIYIHINDSGNYTQSLRLGWKSDFFRNSSWDNRTHAWFSSDTLHINFTEGNRSILYNVTLKDYSPQIIFNISMIKPFNDTLLHYPSWYLESWINISHPNYTWPNIVYPYDSLRLPNGSIYHGNNSPSSGAYGYFEMWDSTRERSNISITPTMWQWAWLYNSTNVWDSSNPIFNLIRSSIGVFNGTTNRTIEYSFTFTRDQSQTCIGAGTFNMTCSFTPVREGNHTVDMLMDYYYVNQSDGNNDQETLTKWDWFWVESEAPAGCDTGPTCDIACNWLLGHTCDCGSECQSDYCYQGVCSSPPAPPYIPPAADEPVSSVVPIPPEEIVLYINETHQFRFDVWNNGTEFLNNVVLEYMPTSYDMKIVPPKYAIIKYGENRSFLVTVTARDFVNETVDFILSSDDTNPQTSSVNFKVISPAPGENVTLIMSQIDEVQQMMMETVDVVSLLKDIGYNTDSIEAFINSISEDIADANDMINSGRYEEAKAVIENMRSALEVIYTEMAVLEIDRPLMMSTCIQSQTISFLLVLAVFCILLFRTRTSAIICSAVISILLLATYFTNLIQRFNLSCYSLGSFVGVILSAMLYYMLQSMVPRKKKPRPESIKLLIFTSLYFLILSGVVFSLVYTKSVLQGAPISPLSIFEEFLPSSVEGIPVSFTRVLNGTDVFAHSMPPNTEFTMTVYLGGVDELVTDYFPKAFELIDAGGGVVTEYNTLYNRIEFDSPIGTYTLRSDGEGAFYFGRAHTQSYREYEAYQVYVTSIQGWMPMFAIDRDFTEVTSSIANSDDNSTTLYEGDFIDIFEWSGDVPQGSIVLETTLFIEIDSSAGVLNISGTELIPAGPDIYAVPIADRNSIRIEQHLGSSSIDHVFLNVTYLSPPTVEITSSVVPTIAEIGDLVLLSATLENIGESPANNTIFQIYDEIYSCGDIPPNCYPQISFNLQSAPIPMWAIWDTGANYQEQYIELFSMSDHLSADATDIAKPGDVILYELTINNNWEKMDDVVIRLNAPFTPYCRKQPNYGEQYCYIESLHKGVNKITFSINIDPGAGDMDMELSVNITYTNPNGNHHTLNHAAMKTIPVRANYAKSISRELTKISGGGARVTPHKVPPSVIFNMTLIVDAQGQVNDTLTDYYPNDFALVNAGGGISTQHNDTHKKITWQVTAPINISYTLQSPSDWPAQYYFGPASFEGISENRPYGVTVADPVVGILTLNAGSSADSGGGLDTHTNVGDALGDFDDTFEGLGDKWIPEYWYFVIDNTSKPSEYVLGDVQLIMHQYQSGYADDNMNIECNLADDTNPGNDWTDLEVYVDTSNEPPTAKENSTWNLTSLCGLNTWTELNQLRIAIRGLSASKGEDTVNWYVDYLNVTAWYTAYGIPEITQIRAYQSSSTTIGAGSQLCDITTPEDASDDTCGGFEGSTTYRFEFKVKNTGEDSLTVLRLNHTLMHNIANSITSCGYDDGEGDSGVYNDECGIIGTNVTMYEASGGSPVSIATNDEYWFYYIFTTKSSISNQADTFINVYDDADSGSTITTLSDNLDVNVVGPPDTITVSIYSDAAYSVPLKTFDVGDTVYIEALIKDSGGSGVNAGTTDCNITYDDAYDGSYEGYDSVVSLSNVGGGEWQGSWSSTGKGDAMYLANVNNSGAAAVFGSTEFHLYSGSGISAYKLDEDGDSNDDYFLENKHLVAVYNGASAAANYLLELYQKDTDVSYTFYDIGDSNMMGQSSPSSSDSGSTEIVTIGFNASEADSLNIVNLDIENSLGSSQVEILVAPDYQTGSDFQNHTIVFENNSGNWFPAYNFTNAFRSSNAFHVVDIDGDDRLETIVGIETYSSETLIQVFENTTSGLASSHNISKAGLGDRVYELEAADLNNQGEDDLEILVCTGATGNPHQSAIFQNVSGEYVNVYNISSGIHESSGCAGLAVGNLDDDSDIEFVVTEEWVTTVYLMIRIFDWTGSTWDNTANYTSFVLDATPDIFGIEIGDVNHDGRNEIVAVPDAGPIQIINYTGSSMVSLWNLTNPDDSRCLVVGDFTNNGKTDIVTTHDAENVVIVFENVTNNIVNTFNISIADLDRCTRAGPQMDLGDIDADGENELVLVGDSADYLKIYRNASLIGSFTLPTGQSAAVEIGDLDNDANSASSFLNITMLSEDADYLLYNLSGWSDTAIASVYFPISGSLGSTTDDDVMYLGNVTEDNTTDFGDEEWIEFNVLTVAQSFISVYDNKTYDADNDNQIAWVEGFNTTTSLYMDSLGIWNQSKDEAAGIRIKYDTSSATSNDVVEFLLVFTQGEYTDINDDMSDVASGSYPTSFYSFTGGECPVIDGKDGSCASEWVTPDHWLIEDSTSDAGGDDTDITNVYSQDDDSYLYIRVDTGGSTPTSTMWINFSDDGNNERCWAKTDGTQVDLCETGTDCGTPLDTCASGCFDNDGDGTDVAEWKFDLTYICGNTCDPGGTQCTGTSDVMYIKVTTADDIAADSAWTEHDFSGDGPTSPIPELPFGAIIALLLPLMITYLFKRRNE